MNTKALVKEGRPLFWPWCAVMLAGIVSMVRPLHSIGWIGLFAVVLGIPLLAVLPLGSEFQNRTLSLLLSQPVRRVKIWTEKSFIAFVSVASVVSLFAFSPVMVETLPDRAQQLSALAVVVAVVASAVFWTLMARSTIGGMALSVGTALLIAGFATLIGGLGVNSFFWITHFTAISVSVLLAYAAVMLWLGKRTLARYQVTGNMAGDDLLTAGSDVILGSIARGARANPTRPLANLIRKELRLLRPVWLITALASSTWSCFACAELLRESNTDKTLSLTVIGTGISCVIIIAILAGCLSLGEEKTSGTYAWHRTLPISPARQWSIKLLVALFASFTCAGLLPMLLLLAGDHLFFPSAFHAPAYFELFWLLAVLVLTLLSFWCACAVNGTVTAVVWLVSTLVILGGVWEFGIWAGPRFIEFVDSKVDLFSNFRITFYFSGLYKPRYFDEMVNLNEMGPNPLILWAPSLILAAIQSYVLFKSPIREGAIHAVRKLLPLISIGLLCTACAYAVRELSFQARWRLTGSMYYVKAGIEDALSVESNRDAAAPLQLSVDDLRKYLSLQRKGYRPDSPPWPWLQGASFTVFPDKAHPTTCCRNTSMVLPPEWNYTATGRLADGTELSISLEPPADKPTDPPRYDVRVRRPGRTSEVPIFEW